MVGRSRVSRCHLSLALAAVILALCAGLHAQNENPPSALRASDGKTVYVAFIFRDDGVQTYVDRPRIKAAVRDRLQRSGLALQEVEGSALPASRAAKGFLNISINVFGDSVFVAQAAYIRSASIQWGTGPGQSESVMARVWLNTFSGKKSLLGYMHNAVEPGVLQLVDLFTKDYVSVNVR